MPILLNSVRQSQCLSYFNKQKIWTGPKLPEGQFADLCELSKIGLKYC